MARSCRFSIENGSETKHLKVILCVLWIMAKESSEREIHLKGSHHSVETATLQVWKVAVSTVWKLSKAHSPLSPCLGKGTGEGTQDSWGLIKCTHRRGKVNLGILHSSSRLLLWWHAVLWEASPNPVSKTSEWGCCEGVMMGQRLAQSPRGPSRGSEVRGTGIAPRRGRIK